MMIGGTLNDNANAKGDCVKDSERVRQPARRQGGKDLVDYSDEIFVASESFEVVFRFRPHPWSLATAELGDADLLVSSSSNTNTPSG